jgi:hypothetical protein
LVGGKDARFRGRQSNRSSTSGFQEIAASHMRPPYHVPREQSMTPGNAFNPTLSDHKSAGFNAPMTKTVFRVPAMELRSRYADRFLDHAFPVGASG